MIFRLGALALVILLCTQTLAKAEYLLQAGDKVRLVYLGLPKATTASTINQDGYARFPLLGRVEAAGKTIDEFQIAAQEASLGRRFSDLGDSGVSVTVELDGFQVFAEIVAYQPIYVIGDVLRAGEIEYSPGMTIRGAIAKAGGASAIPDVNDLARKTISDEITMQRVLAQEYAHNLAEQWRIQALLELNPDAAIPDRKAVPVSNEAFDSIMLSARERFFNDLEGYNTRRADLIDDIEGVVALRNVIDEQITHSETIVEVDRADLSQIEELAKKGLAQNQRLTNSRRSYAISTNQLLDLLTARAESNFQQSDLRTKLNTLDADFRQRLLEKKSKNEQRLGELKLRLQGAREILGGRDLTSNTLRAATGADLSVKVIRGPKGEDVSDTVSIDDPAVPGDIIEVGLAVFLERE